jgi:hypothetical protein
MLTTNGWLERRKLVTKQVAIFFQGLLLDKAHWYRIVAPSSDEPHCGLICFAFPSLLEFLSLEDELFNQVLVEYWASCVTEEVVCAV